MINEPTLLRQELLEELQNNILPFWETRMRDCVGGGFYGRIAGDGTLDADAPRGAIMYGRILWTFASAYRVLGRPEYLTAALSARDYIFDHFVDKEFGGVYWSLDAWGNPLDTKKQFYALGFSIYGMSELARATGDEKALECAKELYRCIEAHSHDLERGGYIEATARDWSELADVRLSDKDENQRKTMNTHLHILEPYTNLYRVWPDEGLRANLKGLVRTFLDRIENPSTHHLGLFFDDDWNETSVGAESYGHDIEATWLIREAAEALGDADLLSEVEAHCRLILAAACEGLREDGSMVYEKHTDGRLDDDRHWWVQCETVIGLFYSWRFYHNEESWGKCVKAWEYIRRNIIDREGGEWYWSRRADGAANTVDDKAGFWKCPYHNSRMCLEVSERIDNI